MGIFSEKRNHNTALAFKVDTANAEEYEKSFKESFLDDWHFQTYTGNSYSKTNNLHDEYEKEIAKIKDLTGKELDNPYNSAFEDFIKEDILWGLADEFVKNPFSAEDRKPDYFNRQSEKRLQKRLDKFNKELGKLKNEFPELVVRSPEQINEDIKKQALEYYQKVNDGRDANGWGSFLGSAAGSMIDPINFFSTLISGGGGAAKQGVMKALGKTAVQEFLINSGIEAVIQPGVYEYKKELGIPYSKEEAAFNVVAAGVGGAVLGTAGKALHLTGKEVLSRYKKAANAGVKFDGKAKADAAFLEKKVQVDDWLDETNPFGNDAEARLLHENLVEREMRRLADETGQLSKAYDDVLRNPVGNANEILAEISPEEMEKIWIDRGGYAKNNGIKGAGFGMVKFIFKHGEESTDTVKISKDDVISFPEIVRKYEPLPETGHGSNRTWSIKNKDGQQIVYSDTVFAEDGQRHLVTIHAITDDKSNIKGIFSEKRRREAKPAHTKDTTQKTFSRTDESSAKASAPESRFQGGGGVMDNNISPDELKVKDFGNYDADAFKRELDAIPNLTPEEKKANADMIKKIKQEDDWDDQILDCIVEFSKK